MNRIYELAKEAGMIEFDVIPDSNAVTPNYTSVVKAQYFAESIIKECANLAYLESCYSDPENVMGFDISKKLKEHFGVG
jgi:hypothetical protein